MGFFLEGGVSNNHSISAIPFSFFPLSFPWESSESLAGKHKGRKEKNKRGELMILSIIRDTLRICGLSSYSMLTTLSRLISILQTEAEA